MPRKKQLSDAHVLDLALDVIRERGPEGFTLSDIARAAALSPATLLQRFGTKAALLESAVKRANVQLDQLLEQAVAPSSRSENALRDWLVELAHPFRTRALIAAHLAVLQQDLRNPRMHRVASRHNAKVRKRIRQHLEACDSNQSKGALDAQAAMIDAQFQGLVLQWAIAGKGSLQTFLRAGLDALFARVLS